MINKFAETQSTNDDSEVQNETEQFITFIIGEEHYGIKVSKIQGIIGMTEITHIPISKPYMKGMINLRGQVLPVVDMRLRFNMEEVEYTDFTVIIIVEIGVMQIAIIVDSVADVIELPIQSIQDTPQFSAKIETEYIFGIGKNDDQVIIILDIDKILTTEDIEKLIQKKMELGE